MIVPNDCDLRLLNIEICVCVCVYYETCEVASESLSCSYPSQSRYPFELYFKHLYFKIVKIKHFYYICLYVFTHTIEKSADNLKV